MLLIIGYGILYFINESLFISSTQKTSSSLMEMIQVLPPVFILLGLLDVWVKKETMVKMMGKDSGIMGILLAFFLGSAAAGPLYAAFPVALTLLRKGSSFRNVLILIGAWSTTKLPLLLFEASSMGLNFTLIRFGLNIVGILGIAYISELVLGHKELEEIHTRSLTIEN
ncbi:MAG: permease [Erysipelotrichaceae bacterium]|nr:permease [Erysipelotrichaceae bacterium]